MKIRRLLSMHGVRLLWEIRIVNYGMFKLQIKIESFRKIGSSNLAFALLTKHYLLLENQLICLQSTQYVLFSQSHHKMNNIINPHHYIDYSSNQHKLCQCSPHIPLQLNYLDNNTWLTEYCSCTIEIRIVLVHGDYLLRGFNSCIYKPWTRALNFCG